MGIHEPPNRKERGDNQVTPLFGLLKRQFRRQYLQFDSESLWHIFDIFSISNVGHILRP